MSTRTHNPAADSHDVVCSICVANYNGMGVIDDCLRSALTQAGNVPCEIIVHDDASTDGSAEHIAAHYPQVRLIRSAINIGFCASNQRMADQAHGQYLLLLNNDAALFPDALMALFSEARSQTRPAIITMPQYDASSGNLIDRGLRLDPFLNPVPNLDPDRRRVATVHGACLWVPTELWRRVGGFPEWFHMLAEDLYLCSVARLEGADIRVTATSGYRHHVGHTLGGGRVLGAQLVTSLRRRSLSERNKNFVMVLCYPLTALLIIFPIHALFLLLEGLALSAVRLQATLFTQIYLPSLSSLWKERHRIVAWRRAIHSRRKISFLAFFSNFTLFPQKLRLLFKHGVPRIQS